MAEHDLRNDAVALTPVMLGTTQLSKLGLILAQEFGDVPVATKLRTVLDVLSLSHSHRAVVVVVVLVALVILAILAVVLEPVWRGLGFPYMTDLFRCLILSDHERP